jgi:hypothetical protein
VKLHIHILCSHNGRTVCVRQPIGEIFIGQRIREIDILGRNSPKERGGRGVSIVAAKKRDVFLLAVDRRGETRARTLV